MGSKMLAFSKSSTESSRESQPIYGLFGETNLSKVETEGLCDEGFSGITPHLAKYLAHFKSFYIFYFKFYFKVAVLKEKFEAAVTVL